jgi:hypothetical protein
MDATGTAATTTPGAGVAESGVRTAAPQGVEREIVVNRERATEVAYLQSLPWYKKVCVIFITPLKTCKFNASLPARGYCRSRDLKRPKTSLFSASPPTTERHVQHRPSTRKVNLGMSAGGEPQIHTDGRVTLVGANAGFARMFTTLRLRSQNRGKLRLGILRGRVSTLFRPSLGSTSLTAGRASEVSTANGRGWARIWGGCFHDMSIGLQLKPHNCVSPLSRLGLSWVTAPTSESG